MPTDRQKVVISTLYVHFANKTLNVQDLQNQNLLLLWKIIAVLVVLKL